MVGSSSLSDARIQWGDRVCAQDGRRGHPVGGVASGRKIARNAARPDPRDL
jgi:hypothetical protein